MKIYVVMGNDYPDAVFTNEVVAERYCMTKRAEDLLLYVSPRIDWRVYPFDLIEETA